MISYNSKYYGAAFVLMIDSFKDGLVIQRLFDDKAGFYLVNQKLPMLFKHSTNRTSPWSFSLGQETIRQYNQLVAEYGECLMVFICGTDGIPALNYCEIRSLIVLDDGSVQKRIGISRKLKQMYDITGSDGVIKIKPSMRSLVDKMEVFFCNGDDT